MTHTYVIADLHGRYDLLMRAFEAIFRHARSHSPTANTIITLGDYVDRGPESCGIIDELMQPINHGWTMINLMGNHEQMMLDAYEQGEGDAFDHWIINGGDRTLKSYGALENVKKIPRMHIAWLKDRPKLYSDEHRIYVHAMVDATLPLNMQKEVTLLWGVYPDGYGFGYADYHVVHGHQKLDQPGLFPGRTNLDTGAYKTGKLSIGVFDDGLAGGPVDIITIYE